MKEIKEGGQPGRHQPNTTKRTKQDITLEEKENAVPVLHRWFAVPNSATRTRTRVARVRAEYPNQLDYSGCVRALTLASLGAASLYECSRSPETCRGGYFAGHLARHL